METKTNVSLFLGFGFFGLLIGFIVGITSAEISNAIIAALFAFIGGKLFLGLDDKELSRQIRIGIVLVGFSLFCLCGILGGICIKTNQLLTATTEIKSTPSKMDSGQVIKIKLRDIYLKDQEFMNNIEYQYRTNQLTCEQALGKLLDSLRNAPKF